MMEKAYRVVALTKHGDRLLAITGSRERALKFMTEFANSPHYTKVEIEVGVNTFTSSNLMELP